MDINTTTSVPMQMPPPYPVATTEYEFDSQQNEVIGSLASSMKFVAIVSLVFGAIEGAIGVYKIAAIGAGDGTIAIFQSILTICISILLLGASSAFSAVVTTQGNDITNLMSALRKLRSVYKTYAVVLGAVIVLVAIVFFLAVAMAGHHAH